MDIFFINIITFLGRMMNPFQNKMLLVMKLFWKFCLKFSILLENLDYSFVKKVLTYVFMLGKAFEGGHYQNWAQR